MRFEIDIDFGIGTGYNLHFIDRVFRNKAFNSFGFHIVASWLDKFGTGLTLTGWDLGTLWVGTSKRMRGE